MHHQLSGCCASNRFEQVLDCLPRVADNCTWSIPSEELEKRRDFRKHCVFTIDPVSARDLDDALHCIDLGDGWLWLQISPLSISMI